MAISDVTKLSIYNGALRRLGSRNLASLTENREPRRVLDDIWGASSEVVTYALERGEWNFAIRSVEGTYSDTATPLFGFSRAFEKPSDFCNLVNLTSDQYFRNILAHDEYIDEGGYWFANRDVIYVRYVSGADDYGFNSERWTEGFKDYLECRLAYEACERLTNSTSKRDRQERDMGIALDTARGNDAKNEGVKFPPVGSWVRSRGGRW